MKLNYAIGSDQGLVRGNNEDSAYAGPHLLILADGMGGHAAGEVASQLMVEHVSQLDIDPGNDDMRPDKKISRNRRHGHHAHHPVV